MLTNALDEVKVSSLLAHSIDLFKTSSEVRQSAATVFHMHMNPLHHTSNHPESNKDPIWQN